MGETGGQIPGGPRVGEHRGELAPHSPKLPPPTHDHTAVFGHAPPLRHTHDRTDGNGELAARRCRCRRRLADRIPTQHTSPGPHPAIYNPDRTSPIFRFDHGRRRTEHEMVDISPPEKGAVNDRCSLQTTQRFRDLLLCPDP